MLYEVITVRNLPKQIVDEVHIVGTQETCFINIQGICFACRKLRDIINGCICPGITLCVITSYSIHYTKLYDASVSILKGAAGTAQYGSRAANGVYMITTKRGQKGGNGQVTYNSSLMLEKPLRLVQYQNNYGQGIGRNNFV